MSFSSRRTLRETVQEIPFNTRSWLASPIPKTPNQFRCPNPRPWLSLVLVASVTRLRLETARVVLTVVARSYRKVIRCARDGPFRDRPRCSPVTLTKRVSSFPAFADQTWRGPLISSMSERAALRRTKIRNDAERQFPLQRGLRNGEFAASFRAEIAASL